MARGKSFAADMRAAPRRPRNPNVEYDEAGNVRNPMVGPKSPYATMQAGRPVPNAVAPMNTLAGQSGDFLRAAGQTLRDTYHLGQSPLPRQTADQPMGVSPAASPPPPPPITPNLPPPKAAKKGGKKSGR
jgi:hypothetical protein